MGKRPLEERPGFFGLLRTLEFVCVCLGGWEDVVKGVGVL